MTLEESYKAARQNLSGNIHIQNSDLEARWIVSELAQINEIEIWANPKKNIDTETIVQIERAVSRRKSGEPLSYVLGFKDFFKYRFLVSPAVLIPRPETEIIVTQVLEHTLERVTEPLTICDLGFGSGCIGLTLLKERPRAQLTAIEISPAACEVALKNAKRLGVDDRLQLLNESVKPSLVAENTYDIVVSNPPYIASDDPEVAVDVKRYEPASALYADAEGFRFIEEWLSCAAQALKPKGFFAFEVGRGQKEKTLKIIEQLNVFSDVYFIKDLQNIDRIVTGRKK